jgi:hypothetical protein
MDVVLAARKERELTAGPAAAGEGDYEDRSRYAVAELPPGIPAWPPEIFTAADQQYTRRWQRSTLCKVHDRRGGLATPRRLNEGKSLSNVVLWLEFCLLSLDLSLGSKAEGFTKNLADTSVRYGSGAYKALRTRVDEFLITHLNPDAANLYALEERLRRDASRPMPSAQRHVGT